MTAFFKSVIRSFVRSTSMPPTDMETEKKGLFAQCSFIVVRSASLNSEQAQQLIRDLALHDGEAALDTYGDSDLDLAGVTHIISNTFDFPDYDQITDAMLPVVRSQWVNHSLAKKKLANTRQYCPDPRMFLSDVVACCADLPEGDADAVAGGIVAMGGLFTSKLTSQVTHIVALSTEAEQCEMALTKNLRIKIVLPHWFDDCLRLGRKIDEQPYLLPEAEILKSSHSRIPMTNQHGQVTGAVDPDPTGTPPPTPSKTRKDQSVFKNKKVMLGKDLGIGSHLRGILEGLISASGGKIVTSIRQCGLFVGKYRQGQDYKNASRAGKHVGNLAWLYFLITTDTWTSPLRRLLHYPIAPDGLPGFKDFRISLSNYTGEARTYLENLINATGAECTKTLKQDNTHLITAHDSSEKCAAAKDWGIHIVNHLWLEESYARWKLQSVSSSRYTHFPSRTNLGEVVGSTQIDRAVLEANFFAADGDVEMIDAPNGDGTVEHMQEADAKAAKPKKVKDVPNPVEHKTPAPSRIMNIDKENITPSTSSSRRSKDVAAARLHNMTPDIALYEKEKKRIGGVVHGGRRKADERAEIPRKRSIEDIMDVDAEDGNEPKKSRNGLPPVTMHLLVSSYDKWRDSSKVEDADRAQLRNLGIQTTNEPSRATHLAAPNIVRTLKFVAAMAHAPAILSTKFIEACLERDEFQNPEDFLLQDKANEKKFGFSLHLSRERAKENRNQLLKGRAVYCMENVNGGFDAYNSIVKANGGQCMTWRNRKGTMVPSRRAESDPEKEEENRDEVCLLSTPDASNTKMWQKFREMVEHSRKQPRIVTTDWLIETVMCQKLLSAEKYEIQDSL